MHHRVSPHFAELSSAVERKFFDNIDHRRNGSFRQPDIRDENLASPVLNNVLRSIYYSVKTRMRKMPGCEKKLILSRNPAGFWPDSFLWNTNQAYE
jgi:hypothetical protein